MTVQKIIEEYRLFFSKHLIVKDFQYMVPKDRFVTNDYSFPLVLIEPVDFTYNTGEIRFNHNLYFIDKVDKDLSNYFNILSTQLQLSLDLYNYFNDNEQDFGFFLYNEGTATPVLNNEFEDWVCGICLPLSAQIQNPRNEPEIPIHPHVIQE